MIPFKEETAEAPAWTDAYLLARDLGYIFTAVELSPYVFLAAEREVRIRYGVRLPRSMIAHTKQPEALIHDLRRQLAAKAYYADAPFDIHPASERLSRADVRNDLEALALKLRGYAGPYRGELGEASGEDATMGRERIGDWLRQFSDDVLIGAALEMMGMMRLIGRHEIGMSMSRFLAAYPDFREAFVCPLGEPRDSSAICTYQAGDIQEDYDFEIVSLPDALTVPGNRPILFVDDFVGSGKQAVTILESLLGEKLSYDLNERRQPLSGPLRNTLKERRLGFLFAAGMDEGEERLTRRTEGLKIKADISITIRESELPVAFPRKNLSAAQSRLRDRCLEVGRELLDNGDPRHTPEWIEERTLGYGNRGFLVLFPYNTPSQTLTCLWRDGTVGSRHWSPLFPRRKKK